MMNYILKTFVTFHSFKACYMKHRNTRRRAIKNILLGSAALGVLPVSSFSEESLSPSKSNKLKGNINHSVCYWCYNSIPLEEFCQHAKKLNIGAIDLIGPKDWPVLKKHGIYSSMCNGA